MYPRPYRAGEIEPVVEVGQNVLVVNREAYNLYQIAYIEPIPPSFPLVMNLGAVLAGAQTAITSTANILDMTDGQLGQFRARVLDDIVVTLMEPLSVGRFLTKNVSARINAYSHLYDVHDHLSEFYVFEDDRPFVQIANPQAVNLAQARIAFYGFRYILSGKGEVSNGGHVTPLRRFKNIEEATVSKLPFTVIPVGGWGR